MHAKEIFKSRCLLSKCNNWYKCSKFYFLRYVKLIFQLENNTSTVCSYQISGGSRLHSILRRIKLKIRSVIFNSYVFATSQLQQHINLYKFLFALIVVFDDAIF